MNYRWNRLLKAVAGVTTAGVLLQTAGCDAGALVTEWVVLVANDFLTSFFYDFFNVQQPFVF